MIERILRTFTSIPGVRATAIVGRDGLVIESSPGSGIDMDALGALASTGVVSMETVGRDFGKGDLDIVISEFTGGTIIMCSLSRKEILAMVTDPNCPIGKIRYEVKRYRELLRDLL